MPESNQPARPNDKLRELINNYSNYFIIGILSALTLIFFPMLGSTVGMTMNLPDTRAGWIVWIATKLSIAAINVLLFHNFILQGKQNIRNDPYYLEASRILNRGKARKLHKPLSPEEWTRHQYRSKGVTIFITSFFSLFALTQAILSYDWTTFIVYLFTLTLGLIFGVMEMKKTEIYYTVEYWQYAKMIEEEQIESKLNQVQALEIGGKPNVS